MTDTVTPQGIVAVMDFRPAPTYTPANSPLHLILDEIGDPGNAGTLLRSAVAAGVSTVFSAPGTVDLFPPKVVRAGTGAHFTLDVARELGWETIGERLPAGAAIYLSDAGAGRPYWDVDWTQAVDSHRQQ